ncbi:hypothetical protein L4D20_22175 [Vibrio kyushuensis]|uniref:hypothetical protein n=1 Tax=Vibrio kyushuensis TaxID=2910249 RepID=UPI003D103629
MKYVAIAIFVLSSSLFSHLAISGETSGHGPMGPIVKCETVKGVIKYVPITYCKIFDGKVL